MTDHTHEETNLGNNSAIGCAGDWRRPGRSGHSVGMPTGGPAGDAGGPRHARPSGRLGPVGLWRHGAGRYAAATAHEAERLPRDRAARLDSFWRAGRARCAAAAMGALLRAALPRRGLRLADRQRSEIHAGGELGRARHAGRWQHAAALPRGLGHLAPVNPAHDRADASGRQGRSPDPAQRPPGHGAGQHGGCGQRCRGGK
jgi:hypothetical protein